MKDQKSLFRALFLMQKHPIMCPVMFTRTDKINHRIQQSWQKPIVLCAKKSWIITLITELMNGTPCWLIFAPSWCWGCSRILGRAEMSRWSDTFYHVTKHFALRCPHHIAIVTANNSILPNSTTLHAYQEVRMMDHCTHSALSTCTVLVHKLHSKPHSDTVFIKLKPR